MTADEEKVLGPASGGQRKGTGELTGQRVSEGGAEERAMGVEKQVGLRQRDG